MNSKPVAVVLGGTSPHIELLNNLRNRGYYTVLVDYYNFPPAKDYADEHIKESTLDEKKVLDIAKTKNASLVISTCVDQANVTACYVGEQLGLPIPYDYKTALNVSNKGFMKEIFHKYDIPTSKFFYTKKQILNEINDLSFPLMIKPADCCGTAGVKKVSDFQELNIYLQDALQLSRTKNAIIEEYKKGDEYSIYGFIENFNVNILMISQRYSVIEGEKQVLKCYATLAPAELSESITKKIQTIANTIARSFNINNSPIHIQVIINEEEVNVIEFAPRVGGGISYRTIKQNTGFDIINATIDSFLGNPVKVQYSKPKQIYSINLIYGNPGVFDKIIGEKELIENNVIESIHYHKTSGMKIDTDKASSSRIAAFLIKANSKKELLQKTKTAYKNIDALDTFGNSLMRKDLYLQ